ncbi:MAG TPA: hemerythrin [Prolixibacteraceae bacterium]|jgi:hemerythrin-like metal-binding protein|nr:hemerythrin [Prolixibacteraceae bacterium]
MTIFGWDEKYSVGIQSIDQQHKEIFRLLDQLFQALKSGTAPQMVGKTITELELYAGSHFHREEFFFREFNYPDSAKHIQEHQKFIDKIAALKADAKAGKLDSTFELLHFLKVWISHHILVVDMEYNECFLKNGLR